MDHDQAQVIELTFSIFQKVQIIRWNRNKKIIFRWFYVHNKFTLWVNPDQKIIQLFTVTSGRVYKKYSHRKKSTHYGKVLPCRVAESLARISQRALKSSRLLPFSLCPSLCALSEQRTLDVKFWAEWKFLMRKINANKARWHSYATQFTFSNFSRINIFSLTYLKLIWCSV